MAPLQPRPSSTRSRHAWISLALLLAVLVLRVLRQHHIVEALPNFSPLMAFAFTGAVLFSKPVPWWSWALLLVVVDWFSGGADWWAQANGHPEVLVSYACYTFAAFAGSRLRGHAGVLGVLSGTVACSVLFYLVTNSLSWWSDAAYAKTFEGWTQALTTGTGAPGLPPTIAFFRNSLLADLAGSLVLLLVYNAEAFVRRLPAVPWVGVRERLV